MNSVQNITSNSAPFMALPNITNYGNIIINYNIKNKKKLLKVFKRKKKIKENYCPFNFFFLWYLFYFYYDFCHHCYNNIYYFVEHTIEKFEKFVIIL